MAVTIKRVVAASTAVFLSFGCGGEKAPERIAFASDRDGNFEIYVMNADGSNQTNLTNDPAGDLAPIWSPDGSRIAFASSRDGNPEVYVMNADGSGLANLTGNPDYDGSHAWSPRRHQGRLQLRAERLVQQGCLCHERRRLRPYKGQQQSRS